MRSRFPILLLTVFPCFAGAMDPLVLGDDARGKFDLAPYIAMYEDPDHEADIETILALDQNVWQRNEQRFIHLGFSDSSLWFKVPLDIAEVKFKEWLLFLEDPLKDEVDVYTVVDGHVRQHLSARANQSFSARPLKHRLFPFPIDLPANNRMDVYVRVRYSQHIFLPISLISKPEFLQQDQKLLVVTSIAAGVFLVMALYNFFVFLATRLRSYLYYVGLVLCAGLYFLGMHGFSYQYLWPHAPAWHNLSFLLFTNGMVIFGGLFTMQLLNIPRRSVAYYIIMAFMALAVLSMGANLVGAFEFSNTISTLLNLVSWGTFSVFGLREWIKGKSFAGYYTIAWSILFLATSILCLGFLQVIEFNLDLLKYSGVAFVGETILNSVALGTRIRHLQSDRRRAIAESNAKLEFMAKMSHELRTPMNGILGMAELLEERLEETENRRYVDVIVKSSRMLLTIINDILDYSKVEAGKLKLEQIPFDIRELVEMTVELHQLDAQRSRVELRAEIAEDVPSSVLGDPTRVNQVLLNLVGNAVKFTQDGFVTVRLKRVVHGNESLEITVEDTGIGIDEQKINGLFESFSQADSSITRTYGGTGLGLAISRQLVELMGGTLVVRSIVGEGSTFTATIPLLAGSTVAAPANEQALQTSLATSNGPLKVLVVEDNEVNQLVVKSMLGRLQHEVQVAQDGAVALEMLTASQECGYDLVLMDCEMPVMDGFTATRKFREWEEMRNVDRTPVLALTAHVLSHQEQSCFAAGMDAVLTKPITLARLRDALAAYPAS